MHTVYASAKKETRPQRHYFINKILKIKLRKSFILEDSYNKAIKKSFELN